MKKIILLAGIILLACGSVVASPQSYTRKGKVFEQTSTRTVQAPAKTGFTWKAADGKEYPVYLSSKGRAYIIKTSKKTGKEYKCYLPKGIEKEICHEMD